MIFQSEREREIFIPEQSAQIESSAETKNHLERRRALGAVGAVGAVGAIKLDQNCESRPGTISKTVFAVI